MTFPSELTFSEAIESNGTPRAFPAYYGVTMVCGECFRGFDSSRDHFTSCIATAARAAEYQRELKRRRAE